MASRPLPLDGVRILEFTVAGAGPMANMILSDMGAEVIRIDDVHRPDVNTRGPPKMPAKLPDAAAAFYPEGTPGPLPYERYVMHNYLCRNRRNVTFTLTDPWMRSLFLDLVKKSDVVISNNAAGMLDKIGFGYSALSQANPRIIVVELPGFGAYGPYKNFRMYGANADALTGHVALRGYPDSDPTTTYNLVHCDSVSAATAAFVTTGALIHRERTGRGQFVDMAQIEAMIGQMPQAIMAYSMNAEVLQPLGNRDPVAVQGVYPARGEDAWLAVAVENDRDWQALCEVIGHPELKADARFVDQAARQAHHDAFDQVVASWCADKDKYEAFRALQDAGVPAAPVTSPADLAADPHLQARGYFEPVRYPYTGPIVDGVATPGEHTYPGPLFDYSESPVRIRSHAASVGEHNDYVFRELLGLSAEDYQDLIARRLIGTSYVA